MRTGRNDLRRQDGRRKPAQAHATGHHRQRIHQQGDGDVEAAQQGDVPAQRADHAAAGSGADGKDEGEHAQRRRPQHPVHDDDHGVGDCLEEFDHARAPHGLDAGQGKAEKQCEDNQWQHRALRRSGNRVGWNDPREPVAGTDGTAAGAGTRNGRTQMFDEDRIPRQQRQQQRCRKRREHRPCRQQQGEHDHRPSCRTPGCGSVVGRTDANDDQGQHQRHHGHLQGIQPEATDRLRNRRGGLRQGRGEPGEAQAEDCAKGEAEQDSCGHRHGQELGSGSGLRGGACGLHERRSLRLSGFNAKQVHQDAEAAMPGAGAGTRHAAAGQTAVVVPDRASPADRA